MLAAGWLRYIALLFTWNLIPLGTATVLVILISTDQGQELLKIDREITAGLLQQLRRIGLPLALYAVLVTLTCVITARMGAARLADLVERYGLPSNSLRGLSRTVLPVLIGYAPMVFIGFAVERAWWIVPIAAIISGAAVLPWLSSEFLRPATAEPLATAQRGKSGIALTLIIVITSAASVGTALQPEAARAVGSIGVAVAALAFWAALLSLLFVALPLRFGLPGLAILAPVPWLIASFLFDPNQFPRRDVTVQRPAAIRFTSVEEQFVRWMLSRPPTESEGPISVYLISAEGGGLRAAYWSARFLAELQAKSEGRFAQHTFAYSGVSGGSLGVATFLGLLKNQEAQVAKAVEALLGRDYLAPLVGRLLLAEPFWQLLGSYSGVLPRDVAFEQQWERDWQSHKPPYFSRPFLEIFSAGEGHPGPAVIFNATNAETGKRVLLANVDSAVVANDYLFPLSTTGLKEQLSDITVGEVVHLSARFPFVSPPASFRMGVPSGPDKETVLRLWGHVVDGGYFDNSGGLAIRDVYESLALLRDAAQRGEAFMSSDPDVKWDRARPLIARAWFHIIVLRNDPLSSVAWERNEYPTLSDPHLANLSGDQSTKAWNDGAFAFAFPARSSLSELLTPFNTMMATRDARASATRRALWERLTRGTHDQRYQCEIARRIAKHESIVFPFTFSAECIDVRGDRYTEVSLGTAVAESSEQFNAAGGTGCDLEDARTVALGWVLSGKSQRAMSCLIANHTAIGELAAELKPAN